MENILDKDAFGEEVQVFATYMSFQSAEQASAYIEVLKAHDISYSAEGSEHIAPEVYTGTTLLPKVVLKLYPKDFTRVNELVEQEIVNHIDLENHQFNQFNNEELRDILEKPDEWSAEGVAVAKKLLTKRGVEVSDDELQEIREQRLLNIRRGKKAKPITMLLWFIGITFGTYLNLLFLIGGIGMGYYYAYDKSTDPDGNKYYTFEPQTRKYGRLMLFIGIPLMIIIAAIPYMYM